MSIASVVSKIVSKVKTVWHEVEQEIEADAAAVRKALPASAIPTLDADVAKIKQAASDALGLAAAGVTTAEAILVRDVEAALDAFITAKTNGAALPLVPLVNSALDGAGALGANAISAYLLKLKAALATQSTASQTPVAASTH